MLETRATVVQTDGQYALVQADQRSGCEQCDGKGCGTGKLSQLFCSKPRRFKVDNPINACVNDEVIVSVAEGAVLRGIGMVYMLPLLLLFIGAVWGNWLGSAGSASAEQGDGDANGDACAAVGALLGLVIGFVVVKWISLHQARSRFQPYIARLLREV